MRGFIRLPARRNSGGSRINRSRDIIFHLRFISRHKRRKARIGSVSSQSTRKSTTGHGCLCAANRAAECTSPISPPASYKPASKAHNNRSGKLRAAFAANLCVIVAAKDSPASRLPAQRSFSPLPWRLFPVFWRRKKRHKRPSSLWR